MSPKQKSDKEEEDKDKKSDLAILAHRERLKMLRKAQEFSGRDDIPKAVGYYTKYLNSLALFHGIKEEDLSPTNFDPTSDITELLLISHVYWDLAKAYDRSPRLRSESERCLNQYIKFTRGFKYQHVNAQMHRNFIKKNLAHNPKIFKDAYERIRLESTACFLASECFSQDSYELKILRKMKFFLQNYFFGIFFIKLYYYFSPRLIDNIKLLDSRWIIIKYGFSPTIKLIAIPVGRFLQYEHNKNPN